MSVMRIAEMTVGGNDDWTGDSSLRNSGDDEDVGTDHDRAFEFAEL